MMSPATGRPKNYADRAIQTEVQGLERLELVSGPTHCSFDIETDGAYTHLSPSSTPFARRTSKRPQLFYNRPIDPPVLAKRIVSLPEPSSEASCNVRKVHNVAGMRIVSLPDPTRGSPQSTENISYLDNSGMSADTFPTSSGSDLGHPRLPAHPRLDIPRTPSPPSSPDSVLIIDNDIHLPNLFLYRQGHSHRNTVIEDDGGWITWASSPPRPIPALHGPLSLPYARCPSGAEGTIIEEDTDLPRMIWGLDLEDFPLSATRNQRTTNAHKPITEDFQSRSQKACQISKEQSLYAIHSPNAEIGFLHAGGYTADPILKLETTVEGANRNTRRDDMIRQPSNQPRPCDLRENGRLNWSKTHLGSASKKINMNEPRLRSSAPVFVPGTSEPFFPGMTTESYTSTIVKPRTLAAIDIARQYCVDQQKNTLPTPPTSSSPQWSPVFPSAPFSQSGEWNFLDPTPRPLSGIDKLENRRFVDRPARRGLGPQHMSLPVSDHTPSLSIHPLSLLNQCSQRTKLIRPLHPIHRTTDLTGISPRALPVTTPFGTVERRVSVAQTHRRLSAVTEEDAGSSNISISTRPKNGVYAALNDPSECVIRLSNRRRALSGFSYLPANTSKSAGLPPDPVASLDFKTTQDELPQIRIPTAEVTPTVKLPFKAPIFSSIQDGTNASGEIVAREKDNPSNTKNNTLPKRGRTRKGSSPLNHSPNILSEWQASADAWL